MSVNNVGSSVKPLEIYALVELHNNGDGTFTDVTAKAGVTSNHSKL